MRIIFACLFALVGTLSHAMQTDIGLELEAAPGTAVKNLPTNLIIRQGEVVALLGPSGSGKTTVLKCLCSIQASEGEVQIYDLANQTYGSFTHKGIGPKIGAMPNGRFRPGKHGMAFEASVMATGATIVVDTNDPGTLAEILMWLQIMSEIMAATAAMNPDLGLSPEGFLDHDFTVLATGAVPAEAEIDTTGWTAIKYEPTLATEMGNTGDGAATTRVVPTYKETVSEGAEATSGATVGTLGAE